MKTTDKKNRTIIFKVILLTISLSLLVFAVMAYNALISITHSERNLKVLKTNEIVDLAKSGNRTYPLSSFLDPSIAYICSMTPYSTLTIVRNQKYHTMLEEAGFEYSSEEETFVYFFDKQQRFINRDYFFWMSNKIRWRMDHEKLSDYCYQVNKVAIRLEFHENILHLVATSNNTSHIIQ